MLANQIAGLGAKMAHINLGLVIGGLGYDVTPSKSRKCHRMHLLMSRQQNLNTSGTCA